MTSAEHDKSASGPRRPPAAPTQWATVTRLGFSPEERAAVTASAPVEGSLALQAPRQAQPSGDVRELPSGREGPQTPELRLVAPSLPGGEEVQVWAARFAQAVVEVLGGDRPLSQLVRWTSHRVYLELDRRLTVLARSTDAGRRKRTVRPQVRSVHVFHPTPESAEVSVHVRHGERSRAIAARLELTRGRWQCTVLQLG